ncbi:MAG TPA: hypothetical protein VFV38_26180, partial [Ktedonobacteraceae bacterium]|nr:hypothetical protein [Ktedonobacteraceae bacterium]
MSLTHRVTSGIDTICTDEDYEHIFRYASRWRGTLVKLTSEQEPQTPFLDMGRPLVTDWERRFQ